MKNTPMELTVQELNTLLKTPHKIFVLDVRQDWEVDIARLQGSVHIPLDSIADHLSDLPPYPEAFVVMCHHGVRSLKVTTWLRERGYQAINLKGGIDAWTKEIDPEIPRY